MQIAAKKHEDFYVEHASAIISCEAAKRFFDGLDLKKLPTIQSLKQVSGATITEGLTANNQSSIRPWVDQVMSQAAQ